MARQILISPDRDTFDKVGHLLSVRAVSVAGASSQRLTHIVTSLISPKLLQELDPLGVTIEDA